MTECLNKFLAEFIYNNLHLVDSGQYFCVDIA